MSGINKVILIGNVGKKDCRATNHGVCMANISIATSEKYKDKSGNMVENTEWHNCVAFGKTGEIIDKYVEKGSKLYIEGKLKTDKYVKDGIERYSTKIIISQIQMLDSRKEQSNDSAQSYGAASGGSGNWNGGASGGSTHGNSYDDVPF